MKKIPILIILLLNSPLIFSQTMLSLEEAQSIAMENNWGLKVSQKQIEAADNRIFKANAGYSPVIDWNTSYSGSFNQVNQKFFDGRSVQRFGTSITPNTNLSLAWTLYDGRRMQAVYSRLNSQGQQSRIQNQLLVQNTLSNVMQAYYDIQRLQQSKSYLEVIIGYYEERLKITEERWQIGRGSKLDFLQSKTDYSTQKANLVNTLNELKGAKIRLNGLLARDPKTEFEVNDLSGYTNSDNLEILLENARMKNQEYLLLKKSEEINLLNQKEAKSFKLPRVGLTSSFGYNFNTNNAGLITFNQSVGLNTGITATWRVFDGQLNNRNIQLAKINGEIIKVQKEEWLNNIEMDITTAYYQNQNDETLLKLELENKALAEENLEISLEKFKLGASTILELNDAQTRFNNALSRLVNAQYNVKISALELLRLSGQLAQ
ncbi:TolC family protein [Lacihabitans lacunae]|uniref:TolC family protein n=1 Tax=Lacihabitans lacunae TaxID=1028214 RepID=A0ABV7YUC9_9BACT